MEVVKLSPTETASFKQLISIFTQVFEQNTILAQDSYLEKLLNNPDFMVFVVKLNKQLVGGLTIYVLHQYYAEKPLAYIYDVGILPDFQRQGLGKYLMEEAIKYCQLAGFEAAYVEAEADDLDAVQFYKRTEFSEMLQAVHFTYTFFKHDN